MSAAPGVQQCIARGFSVGFVGVNNREIHNLVSITLPFPGSGF